MSGRPGISGRPGVDQRPGVANRPGMSTLPALGAGAAGAALGAGLANRFGVFRVMVVGALLYAGGLLLMRYASTPLSLDIGAGVLIGFGLSGSSFNLVLSAFSKLLPPTFTPSIENRGSRNFSRR